MEKIEEVNVEQPAVRGDNGKVVANGEDYEDKGRHLLRTDLGGVALVELVKK